MEVEFEIITGPNIKKLDNGAVIHRFSHVVKGAQIGSNAMVGSFCYVAKTAKIGDNTRVQNHVNIYDGVELGTSVFVGPHTVFTNHHNPQDRFERLVTNGEFIPDKIIVGDNATICANVTIIAPSKIGEGARIGAGSVVLKDIAAKEQKNGLIKNRGPAEQKRKPGRPKKK